MSLFKARSVNGISIPRRRFTGWAALYFAVFVCVPILGFALLLDIVFYLIFTHFLGRCYGVLCLLN